MHQIADAKTYAHRHGSKLGTLRQRVPGTKQACSTHSFRQSINVVDPDSE